MLAMTLELDPEGSVGRLQEDKIRKGILGRSSRLCEDWSRKEWGKWIGSGLPMCSTG